MYAARLILMTVLLFAATPPCLAQWRPNVPSHWPPLVPDAPKRSALNAQGIKPMEGDQIKGLYVGNTIHLIALVHTMGLRRGEMNGVYFPNEKTGVLRSRSRGRLEMPVWLEGDAFCGESPMRDGLFCALIYPLPDRFYMCSREQDICGLMVMFSPGNPEKL